MKKLLFILILSGLCGFSFASGSFQLGELSWVHQYGTNATEKTVQIPSGYTIVSAVPILRGNEGAQAYFSYSSAASNIVVTPIGSKSIGTYKGRFNVTLQDGQGALYPNCWVLLTEEVSSGVRGFSGISEVFTVTREGETVGPQYADIYFGGGYSPDPSNPFYLWDETWFNGAFIFTPKASAAPFGATNWNYYIDFTASVGVSGASSATLATTRMTVSKQFPQPLTALTVNGEDYKGQVVDGVDYSPIASYGFSCSAGYYQKMVSSGFTPHGIYTYRLDENSQTWGSHDAPAEADPINPQPDEANSEEPINFISGNNHFPGIGLTVPVPGIPLSFGLTYNSMETNSTPVGPGWRHSYDWSLAVTSNAVAVKSGDARIYIFSRDSNGGYSASLDNNWRLTAQTNSGTHTLHLPGGRVYQFDTNGVLQSISDDWNNAVALSYSNGVLVSAEHSNGQALEFAYSNGLLRAVSAATNLSLVLTYNTSGVLTQTVRNAGLEQFVETYNYNAALLMTQKMDAVGSEFHYTYDAPTGKATGMYLTDNRWYEHTVEYSGTLSRVSYVKGADTLTHDYDFHPGINRVLEERFESHKTTFDYTTGGDVTHKTVYDTNTNRWTQVYRLYDGWHNITNEAFGLSATPTNITKYTWHPQWQTLTSVIDPEGVKQEYEYTNGVIALERIWLSSNTTVETKYSYTTNGLLSAVTNANGHSMALTYDTLGYPQSVVPQTGPVMTFAYDALGHLTNSALPGGRNTGYTVTPLGWVERIETADGLYAIFQYNGLGKVTNQVDRAGRVASYAYAPGGKLAAISRQLGSTNVTVSYDFDQQFNTLSIRDELNRPVESYALDPLDRPVAVTNLEGQTMSVRYLVGNFVDSITRFDGTVVSNQYNGDGRLTAVSYPGETNRYTYLRNGLVRTLANSEGIISNAWNSAGWLMSVSSQPSVSSVYSVVNYSYDLVGNVTNAAVSLNNPSTNNLTTSYSYDEAERLKSITTENTEYTEHFACSYNPDNGLVASVSNGNLRAEYEYDLMNRVTRVDWKNSWGTTILSFDYQYNAAGMITNRVLTGGSGSVTTGYQYDDLDRLTSESSATSVVNYSYDAAGNRLTKQNPDSTVSYTLGSGNRLQGWAATSTNGFAGFRTVRVEGHSSEAIGTDNRWGQLYVSNTVAVTPEISGTNFWIDGFTVGMGTQTVVAAIRDQAGNVGYATNEIFLTVVTNAQYGYNAAGCVTNIAYDGTQYAQNISLGWNSQYQLTSAGAASNLVQYSYDVLDRKISRVEGTNVEYYVYAGNQVVADVDASGNLLRTYVWGPGIDNLLAITTYSATETNTYYPLTDHLNTVHALVDATGQIIERYEYDAWGKVLGICNSAGDELTESAVGNRYLWQGREYDSTTGLYYFRARWYDPVVGRWLSNDPIGISGGLNQYVFCGNSPVNATDPSGLDVIFLLDSNNKSAVGNGHAGILIGNDATGWNYMSYGPYKQDAPVDNLRTRYFPTLRDAIHSADPEISRYDRAAWYRSTPAQDQMATKKMEEYRGKKWKAFSSNCNDAATEAMQAAGTGFKDVSWKPYANFWYNFWNTPGMINDPNSSRWR